MSDAQEDPDSSGWRAWFPRGDKLRRWLVDLFVTFNLAFLAVDIYIAHAANEFANTLEWIPIYFSAVVPFFLIPGLVTRRINHGFARWVGIVVGALSIVVGVGGMFLHLESAFFQRVTLKSLVYSAPFVAPLAYAGVGLLLLLNRIQVEEKWADWIIVLGLGGFVGNFGLSVLDHAQNGFFATTEWIPVVAAGLGIGFLVTALYATRDRGFLKLCLAVMALEAFVGVLGSGLHLASNLEQLEGSLWYKLVYGAPVFAPLLFPNTALLAAIGLWEMLAEQEVDVSTQTQVEGTSKAKPSPASDS